MGINSNKVITGDNELSLSTQ